MASRVDLAKQYMGYQTDRKFDELLALLADDVALTSPMTGTINGKSALEQTLRNSPMGGGAGSPMGNITWGEPEEDGDSVKIVGTGSPFGPLKITLTFSPDDQINKIEAGLA